MRARHLGHMLGALRSWPTAPRSALWRRTVPPRTCVAWSSIIRSWVNRCVMLDLSANQRREYPRAITLSMGNANAKAASRPSTAAAATAARSASEGRIESPIPSSSSMTTSSTSRTASHPPPRSKNRRRNEQAVVNGGIERGQEAVEDANRQLSYWYMARHGYDQMVNLIIRPPRAKYELEELGPTAFTFCGRRFERTDFHVPVQRRGQTLRLQCSHWHPIAADRPAPALPCLVYLHGNSSCRLEAHSILRCVLSTGATVVALDCIGCGLSDGDYITLGYFERDDVHAVIEHLRSMESVSTIGLWGRSMGAVTALLHADRDPSIAGLVVDSAFANLDQLVHEMVEHGRQEGYTIPTLAVKIVMRFIRSSVLKRAHFDLKELSPIDHVDKSFIPALFVAAHNDTFIRPRHTESLFEKYAGDKNLIKVQGDHNSPRPQYLLDSVGIFLQCVLHMDPSWQLHDPFVSGSAIPWCLESQLFSQLMESSASLSVPAPTASWSCQACTFINAPGCNHCLVCDTAAEVAPTSSAAPVCGDAVALPLHGRHRVDDVLDATSPGPRQTEA